MPCRVGRCCWRLGQPLESYRMLDVTMAPRLFFFLMVRFSFCQNTLIMFCLRLINDISFGQHLSQLALKSFWFSSSTTAFHCLPEFILELSPLLTALHPCFTFRNKFVADAAQFASLVAIAPHSPAFFFIIFFFISRHENHEALSQVGGRREDS